MALSWRKEKKVQKESNYQISKGYRCPYCGQEHNEGDTKNSYLTVESERLEEKIWSSGDAGYMWTEDVKCKSCNKKYSQYDGC